jgi:hypothetical protein
MPVSTHHRDNGRRILALINRALKDNGISRSRLADETGYDGAQITRLLDGDGNLPPSVLAAVIELDRQRVLIAGLCGLVGCDAVERKPDPAAENKRLRAALIAERERIDQVLAEVGAA